MYVEIFSAYTEVTRLYKNFRIEGTRKRHKGEEVNVGTL